VLFGFAGASVLSVCVTKKLSNTQTAQQVYWAVAYMTYLFANQLIETTQGLGFVLINIKHRQQLGDHQQILNLIGEIQ
jgi:hypothetical protein